MAQKRTRTESHSHDNSNPIPPSKKQKVSNNEHSLPIDRCKEEILSLVTNPEHDIIIITGDTGSGKSTKLSQILYNSNKFNSIVVTQPRRIGAVSVSRRVAMEMNCSLGTTVGFRVRFNDCTSRDTHIRYVTDGILLRELTRHSKAIEKCDAIILDEAHERSLETDILFSVLRQMIRRRRRKKKKSKSSNVHPFKLIITSATLSMDKFTSFFPDAPLYHIDGRCHGVEVFHCKSPERDYLNAAIETALKVHLQETDHSEQGQLGHILCFLTGKDEIDRAVALMGDAVDEALSMAESESTADGVPDCIILGASGSMSQQDQQSIFATVPPNCRKIIFATNIAETSLTVEGVAYVIDPGLVKQRRFDADYGMDRLSVVSISKSAAIQRKGRAGRTRPGKCYRLYTRSELSEFDEDTVPEILRSDLCSMLLTLKTLGIEDVANFDYLDCPDTVAISNSLTTLYRVGAIDRDGKMHDVIGEQMAAFPLDPRFSKMLIESVPLKAVETALSLVAIISANSGASSDLLKRPNRNASDSEKRHHLEVHQQFDSKYGDLMSWLLLFNHFQKICGEQGDDGKDRDGFQWTKRHFVNHRTLKTAMKIRKQLEPIMISLFGQNALSKQCSNPTKAIRKVLARSLFMQCAKRLDGGSQREQSTIFRLITDNDAVCSENVFIHPASKSSSSSKKGPSWEWVVYLELVISSKPYLKGICSVKYEWMAKLLPRIAHKIQWLKANENQAAKSKYHPSDTSESKQVDDGKDASDTKVENAKKQQQRNEEIDSVKQRYLKRRLLKQKLKSL